MIIIKKLKNYYNKMIEKINYRKNMVLNKVRLLIQNLFLKFYMPRNKELKKIIIENRKFLKTQQPIFSKNEFDENQYGMSYQNFKNINKEVSSFTTYSDLLNFIINNLYKRKVNYLEIGSSVMKNFVQILNYVENSTLYCFDINEIPQKYRNLFIDKNIKNTGRLLSGKVKSNNIHYFKGNVFSELDAQEFKENLNIKFDLIFSDALHIPDAVLSEFANIITPNLSDEFTIYYDDLDFPGLENTFFDIFNDLKSLDKVYATTFYIYGWMGQYEKVHKNGIISTHNLEDFFKHSKIRLPRQKFY